MMTSPTYNANAYSELRTKTKYEIYLLEATYSIQGQPVVPRHPDQLIYPPSGGEPKRTVYGSANIVFGDWRSGFLDVGAPLVFSTTFKLLDMFVEWMLACNGAKVGYRFTDKVKALRSLPPSGFPPAIAQYVDLCVRIVELYVKLAPLRNTITHDHTFTSSNGSVTVNSTRKSGTPQTVSRDELRDLSILAVYLVHYVVGNWAFDDYRRKQLRWTLDKLHLLHGQTKLGQLQPLKLGVRVYRPISETYEIDLDAVRSDVNQRDSTRDIEFDIRLVVVDSAGSNATAYMIPWNEVDGKIGVLTKATKDLVGLECEIPDDFDITATAQVLYQNKSDDQPEEAETQ